MPLSFYLSGTGANCTANGLPDGLTLNATQGRITGTPTAAGIYTVPVSTTNAAGTANALLTVCVAAAPDAPTVSSSAGTSATAGAYFGYSISTGSTSFTSTPTSYGADNLPPGLSLDAASAYISGTPTQAGAYTMPISAVSASLTSHATVSLTVLLTPATPAASTLPVFPGLAGATGFVGNPFEYGPSLYGFALDDALPDGFFVPVSGVLSGYLGSEGDADLFCSATHIGGAGHAILNLRFVEPELSLPRMIAQPVGGGVIQGAAVTLASAAVGVPIPSFQWTHNGVLVPGATGPELDLASALPVDAGTYIVTATNSSRSAVSLATVLSVTQTYFAWQNEYFSPGEIAGGLAAGSYDFNGDGLSNLLEYTFGRNPRTGMGGNVPVAAKSAKGALQIKFNRAAARRTWIMWSKPPRIFTNGPPSRGVRPEEARAISAVQALSRKIQMAVV